MFIFHFDTEMESERDMGVVEATETVNESKKPKKIGEKKEANANEVENKNDAKKVKLKFPIVALRKISNSQKLKDSLSIGNVVENIRKSPQSEHENQKSSFVDHNCSAKNSEIDQEENKEQIRDENENRIDAQNELNRHEFEGELDSTIVPDELQMNEAPLKPIESQMDIDSDDSQNRDLTASNDQELVSADDELDQSSGDTEIELEEPVDYIASADDNAGITSEDDGETSSEMESSIVSDVDLSDFSEDEQETCPRCDKVFETQEILDAHMAKRLPYCILKEGKVSHVSAWFQ